MNTKDQRNKRIVLQSLKVPHDNFLFNLRLRSRSCLRRSENLAVYTFKKFIFVRFRNCLRWLDTVFKKLRYSLLNALNFRTVKFISVRIEFELSNYGSFDDQCSIAMAPLAYEICLKTVYFAA